MRRIFPIILALALGLSLAGYIPTSAQQSADPSPPAEPVKLIFIHHSVGENWLTDGYGDLGRTLAENNYFVSDTNYGWGPDGIGDSTDYPDWYDWFLGPESARYMQAVYAESGQHSDYTRLFGDPGGENQIIIFKSCFPNSDLSGSPDDPPAEGEWFTVGHAKYVYLQLLEYFAAHPDKLFIAITPPPLLDPANAANARAFSRWMVEDWLADYPLNNVAVWDLHNVLTHPDNHHRFADGAIQYEISRGDGTLYYDSGGDNHPNMEGSRKLTEEFVPMLNIFYHRWMTAAPASASASPGAPPPQENPAPTPPQGAAVSPRRNAAPIDDFEGGAPPGTEGWQAYTDEENPNTTLSCGVDSSVARDGISSLRVDFYIEPESWATCALLYDTARDFSAGRGLAFDYRAGTAGLLFDVDVYTGPPDARATYHFTVESLPESVEGWAHYELPWERILGAEWEAQAGHPVDPSQISGFALGFDTLPDTPNTGTLWMDNFALLGAENSPPAQPQQASPETTAATAAATAPPPAAKPKPGLCPGSLSLGLLTALLAGVVAVRRERR